MAETTVADLTVEFVASVSGRAYGIIGTSILPLLDSFARLGKADFVTTRHEQAAVSAADAEGRVTGRPGVAIVHAGPGALNAALSLGIAYRDRAPLILFVGGVRRRLRGTSAWLEVDLESALGPITKAYHTVTSPTGYWEILAEALNEATTTPRGPVVVEVPEDLWKSRTRVPKSLRELLSGANGSVEGEQGSGDATRHVLDALTGSRKPLILACGELVQHAEFSQDSLLTLAEKIDAFIVTSGNGRGACPEDHPRCLGRVGFGGGSIASDKALEESDLLIVFGNEFDDITTYAYTLLPEGEVIVVSQDPDVEKRPPYYTLLRANPLAVLDELAREAPRMEHPDWRERINNLRTEWTSVLEDYKKKGGPTGPGSFFDKLDKTLPRERIIAAGQGTHVLYTYAFMRVYKPRSFLAATNLGAMSYAFPAALGARLASGRQTVVVVGDGDFMMTVQELETMVRKRVPVGIVVINDNSYRVLYLKQLIQYQGRVYETLLGNPDFSKLAEAFGVAYVGIEDKDSMERAISLLADPSEPVLVELRVEPDDLPPVNLEATLRMSM